MRRIPRTIHYCWFGNAPMSELGERCLATWRAKMPAYRIERWDESRMDLSIPYVAIAHAARMYAFVADYVRLVALHEHGGVYFDTDVEVLRNFDGLLGHDLFFGLEAPRSIGVAVIGSVKGHPFLRLLLDKLDEEGRRGELAYEPLPQLVTRLAAEAGDERPTLFPEDYFYPYNPYSSVEVRRKPLQSHISNETFCVHHWEGSWLGELSLKNRLTMRLKMLLRKPLAPKSDAPIS